MKIRNLFRVLVVLFAFSATYAHADIITFEGHVPTPDFSDPQYQDGFRFDFTAAGWTITDSEHGGAPYTHNGTTRLLAAGVRSGSAAFVDMTPEEGGTFSLAGFDAATMFPDVGDGGMTITGFLEGGGIVETTIELTPDYTEVLLPESFSGLESVRFQSTVFGSFRGGGVEDPGFAIDNLKVDEPFDGGPQAGMLFLMLPTSLTGDLGGGSALTLITLSTNPDGSITDTEWVIPDFGPISLLTTLIQNGVTPLSIFGGANITGASPHVYSDDPTEIDPDVQEAIVNGLLALETDPDAFYAFVGIPPPEPTDPEAPQDISDPGGVIEGLDPALLLGWFATFDPSGGEDESFFDRLSAAVFDGTVNILANRTSASSSRKFRRSSTLPGFRPSSRRSSRRFLFRSPAPWRWLRSVSCSVPSWPAGVAGSSRNKHKPLLRSSRGYGRLRGRGGSFVMLEWPTSGRPRSRSVPARLLGQPGGDRSGRPTA
ncbi:MAG: hypothetical protein ACYTGZ_18215 [Planctomycetota bacterium]|jgi:hypothetical protein